MRGRIILISRFISRIRIIFRESISSVKEGNRISAVSSNGDWVGRIVGWDIKIEVIESFSKIDSGRRPWKSNGSSKTSIRNVRERAVPSSSSVSTNSWCSSEDNSCVIRFVIVLQNDPEGSSSRGSAHNIVDVIGSNVGVRSFVAVVRIIRRSSVAFSIDIKITRSCVHLEDKVSSVGWNSVLEDRVSIFKSNNGEGRREGRNGGVCSRAHGRIRTVQIRRKSNRSSIASLVNSYNNIIRANACIIGRVISSNSNVPVSRDLIFEEVIGISRNENISVLRGNSISEIVSLSTSVVSFRILILTARKSSLFNEE